MDIYITQKLTFNAECSIIKVVNIKFRILCPEVEQERAKTKHTKPNKTN